MARRYGSVHEAFLQGFCRTLFGTLMPVGAVVVIACALADPGAAVQSMAGYCMGFLLCMAVILLSGLCYITAAKGRAVVARPSRMASRGRLDLEAIARSRSTEALAEPRSAHLITLK